MTTESTFLQTILADPSDDAARLIYADHLVQTGDTQEQHDRAEFIQVQCELARLNYCADEYRAAEGPRITVPRTKEQCAEWRDILAKIKSLRRRESELLAQTHAEKCPRCKGEGACPTCGGSHEVAGDYFADDGCGPCDDCTRGECPECGTAGTIQVSNCVRWAGKLGGVEPTTIIDDFVHYTMAWNLPHGIVQGRFRRGFIDCISTSCACLMGERCSCRRLDQAISITNGVCDLCHGSGRVGGCLRDLATGEQFAGLMPGGVVLSDKKPECDFTDKPHWGPENKYIHGRPCTLPRELYDLLPEREEPSRHKVYSSAPAALSALSSAVFALLRSVRTPRKKEAPCST